jgi:hypothetical protein
MKNKKIKKFIAGVIIGTNIFMLAACGSTKKESASDSAVTEATTSEMSSAQAPEAKYDTSMSADSATATTKESATGITGTQNITDTSASQIAGQKLIKDVNMSVETKEFDAFIQEINSQISSLGGYVQSSNVSGGSYQYDNYRNGNIVARIPADKLDGFVSIVKEKGNVVNTSEMTTDVTLQYVDMESHIKALKVEQETLLGLLEKAEKMEDVIAIQSQLTQVRYELDSYESQIRTYDNLVNYSTVTINITEVERETNTDKPSFFNEIKAKLSNNLYNIKDGFRNFAINLIAALPYLVIGGAIILIMVVTGRKIYKRIDINEKKIKAEAVTKYDKAEEKDETKE